MAWQRALRSLTPSAPHQCLQGSYEGLRAWGICQLVRLGAAEAKKGKKAAKVGVCNGVGCAKVWSDAALMH